jgi:DNA recombination protein RmuC
MDPLFILLPLMGAIIGAVGTQAYVARRASVAVAERDQLLAERMSLIANTASHEERSRQAEQEVAALQARLDAEQRAGQERLQQVRDDQQRLLEQFQVIATDALRHNNTSFLELADQRLKQAHQAQSAELDKKTVAVEHLVAPLRETLGKVEGQLRELESARLEAYTKLTEQVSSVRTTSEQLRTETSALVTARRAPQARGRWGEMQLRRVVELAGMVEHCDFDEQASVRSADGVLRPDMVVNMAGDKQVVIDSKVSLAAYLEAAETADEERRADRLRAHARHLRKHVDDLAGKAYWTQFSTSPEFVVLFVPGEAFLAPALEIEPTLIEYAMGRRVIIATPTTLMTMLRTIAYAWQQAQLTDNAKQVFELGRELYERLGTLGNHFTKLGRSVSNVVTDYNKAIASLDTRVMVTARRLKDLQVVDGDLPTAFPISETARQPASPELVQSANRGKAVRALPGVATMSGSPGDAAGEDERFGLFPVDLDSGPDAGDTRGARGA